MKRYAERLLALLIVGFLGLIVLRRRGEQRKKAEPAVQSLLKSRSAVYTHGSINKQPIILHDLEPANSTLGFGAIAAVSRFGSPRLDGLILAANITDIHIIVPPQPTWTDDDLQGLLAADGNTALSRGSALAWLAHLNVLRWFLSTDLETVLIFEDDVDWDIHLRTTQIPTAASAIRRLTNDSPDSADPIPYLPSLDNYWGNTSSWDLLYLGHCGDIFRPEFWTDDVPRIVYEDETVLPYPHLHPYTAQFFRKVHIPSGMRMVHRSIFPLCTFGFALTRRAAERLLNEIANREPDGGSMAYDVRVLEACRDFGFRCWSVNPELFHHIDGDSMISGVNQVDVAAVAPPAVEAGEHGSGGQVDPSVAVGQQPPAPDPNNNPPPPPPDPAEQRVHAQEPPSIFRTTLTPNIACPIRSKDFYSQDPDTIAFLRDEVGRKGQCLLDVMEYDGARVADLEPDTFNLPDDWVGDERMQ